MDPVQKIEIRFTLDRSGSMGSKEKLVQEGVNGYLAKVRTDPKGKDADLSIVQFDDQGFDLIRKGRAGDVEDLKDGEYQPRALTPLHDAVASMLTDGIEPGVKYVAVIFTDGLENASKGKYKDMIDLRKLVEQRQAEGWIIIYLGANIDAWQQAQPMGIPQERVMNVHTEGRNQQPAPQDTSLWGRAKNAIGLGGGGNANPLGIALLAAGGLGLAYLAFRPSSAQAAPLGFTDADRNAAMGVDGVSKTWQDAVKEDVAGFSEPFSSIFDLPQDLQQASAMLPADFDPALGSMDADGNQTGGFDYDGDVTSPEDVPGNADDGSDEEDDLSDEDGGDESGSSDDDSGSGSDGSDGDTGDDSDSGLLDSASEFISDAAGGIGDALGSVVEGVGDVVGGIFGD